MGQLTADGIEALPTLLQVLLSPLVQGTNHANGCKGETLPSRRIPVFLLSAAAPLQSHGAALPTTGDSESHGVDFRPTTSI